MALIVAYSATHAPPEPQARVIHDAPRDEVAPIASASRRRLSSTRPRLDHPHCGCNPRGGAGNRRFAAGVQTVPMIPNRYRSIVALLITSLIMSCIVSGVSVAKSTGLTPGFVPAWLSAWGTSWMVAFPVLLVVLPLVQRMVSARFTG